MSQRTTRRIAAMLGSISVIAAAATTVLNAGDSHDVAGGSGASATGTSYVYPTVPAMQIDPTDLSTGATVTAAAPATALATSVAAPTFKASPEAGCVNNGQCP
ncbi:hypothetical protein [Mycolicibacterium komossense]|uniref:Uncharacterized protein n=1 Tax=Mycolicibacterium komossense TaxID=1779 RepID=A0ABT3CM70_9MYCO|nr:hypothetical protein [Mycolicibacterium komossense]MCV7230524.1 hypothetical protein [Mycolicibacterium komossense]